MAKLSDLIPTLAEVVGMPDTAVGAYARNLRKAGEISSGGRGPGGAEMTPRDCANLLTAVMAGSPTHAVERLKMFRSITSPTEEMGERSASLFATVGLPIGHSFPVMLERVIRMASKAPLREQMERSLIDAGLIPTESRDDYFPSVSITVELPDLRASLTVRAHKYALPGITEQLWIYYMPKRYWKNKGRSSSDDPFYGDLRHEVTISGATIEALGQLLAKK